MSTKRFVLAALASGVTVFLVGGLIYGLLAASFFEANQGSVNAMRDTPDYFHLFLGQVMFGVLLTIIIGKWANLSGAAAGLRIGAVVGLVFGFAIDLTLFGVTNMANITATLVDPFFAMIQMAAGGAVAGAVLQKVS